MRVIAESLGVTVAGRQLFDTLSFRWQGPGVVAVIGPSGIGKSTLLSVVMGWTRVTAGLLRVEPAGSQVWLVPQNAPLLDARTAVENLEVATLARQRCFAAAPSTRRIEHALDLFGLRSIANTPAKHLSGGERQRVALACAAVRHPAVLLADEVTAGLDPGSVQMVIAALRSLADTGTLVVVATHDRRVWTMAREVLDLAAVAR